MILNSAAADPNDASHLFKLLATLSMGAIASPPGRYCSRLLNEWLFSNETNQLAQLIQKIPGESAAQMKEISANWLLHRQISKRCWQGMANSSFKRIRSNALYSFFPHERQVVKYMQNCNRGILAQADILPIMFHYAGDGSRLIDGFPVVRSPGLASVPLALAARRAC